ncbi:MAG: DUF4097 family beta strand repeat-containing protein [Bdellovibrio sp.]
MIRSTYKFVFILVLSAVPATASAVMTKWPLQPADKVKISVGRAQVGISRSNDAQLSVQTTGPCRELQAESAAGHLTLREPDLLKPRSESDLCVLQITLPAAQSLDVHVIDGSLVVQKLTSELVLHVQKGKLTLRNSSGSAQAHVQKGDLVIQDYSGRVKIDTLQAPASIRNLQGDLELQALAGDHTIEKSKGNFRVNQAQGSLKVTSSSGALSFETVRANLNADLFNGRIEGQTQEGTVTLKLVSDADVNIKSQAGKINLQAQAGTNVNLMIQEGDLFLPPSMSVVREGSAKSIRGRTRGEGAAKGSVFVRSQEGTITLR